MVRYKEERYAHTAGMLYLEKKYAAWKKIHTIYKERIFDSV